MYLEEYGFVIGIMEDMPNGECQESYHSVPVPYDTKQMETNDAIITLYHNGKTLADVGLVWRQDTHSEPATYRFDAYKVLRKGKENDSYEQQVQGTEDVVNKLLRWAIGQAAKNEMPELAAGLEEFMRSNVTDVQVLK